MPGDDFIDYHLADLYEESESAVSLLNDERYTERFLIGEGGLKKVYRVYDNYTNRYVALARIKGETYTMGQSLDFIREIQLCSALEHPNIVRIYDIGIDEDGPWFTMELMSGTPLSQYMEEHSLTSHEILSIFQHICDAISAAHAQDVLHLDLKPENVIMGAHRKVTVCDWGIGHSEEAVRLNATNDGKHVKGTPGFMAPEQHSSTEKKTKASDVYGLAALLYFLLTQKTVDEGDASLSHPALPERLVPLLQKALSPSPLDRYLNAQALSEEIHNYQEGYATEAENATTLTQAKLFILRNKMVSLVTCGFLLVTAGSFVLYLTNLRKSHQETQHALHSAEEAQQVAEQTLIDLKVEEDMRMQLNDNFRRVLLANTRKALDDVEFQSSMNIAQNAYRLNPDNPEVIRQLGFTYFIFQDYEKAAMLLEQASMRKDRDLELLAKMYREVKKPSEEQLIAIIEKMHEARPHLVFYILHYDSKQRPLESHARIVEALFRANNPKIPLKEFSYNVEERSLKIKGGPFKFSRYSSNKEHNINYLSSLPIEKLILINHPKHRNDKRKVAPTLETEVVYVK